MVPSDINFNTCNISLKNLEEKIRNHSINYISFDKVDARLFELCFCHFKLDRIIVRYDSLYDINIDDKFSLGWSVYKGHIVCETIKKFIIDDIPLYGLEIFADLNGKRYSELTRPLQRLIEEALIEVFVDRSFYNTKNDSVVNFYCDVLNNLR